jgi:hypothetical protein
MRLLMISAMYENGGNTVHRLLDGHPELFVYPFESQLGTRLVNDALTSMFPVKYRWPVFDLDATDADNYRAIIDEECKVRARTPHVSKFRHVAFEFSDDERLQRYLGLVARERRSAAGNVAAFFEATFGAWTNRRASGREKVYVGYSPIIVVDAQRILTQMPDAHVLHVVRNPWSAYADTKKRPVPLALENYMLGWCVCQHAALVAKRLFPDRMHILRFEDIVAGPREVLAPVCNALGIAPTASLGTPSWNGEPLQEIYPWGTIRNASPAANLATASELGTDERAAVRNHAGLWLQAFDYEGLFDPT